MSTSPPRLLAGATLIFWGGLTEHTMLGLIAAIILEARAWVGLRWDFKRDAYIKAWQFCILCGAFISILAWMNGMKVGEIHTMFVWAPLIVLPLELAQRYGNASNIPLNTFSFFARKKMKRDLEQGRNIYPRKINTGYPYIAVAILATAMASRNELYHFIGLSLVIGACLFAYMRKSGFRPWAWASAFLLVIFLSYIGQWGMFKLYYSYTGAEEPAAGHRTSANESRTSIGRLGKLKLSPRIFWRMKVTEGNTPKLLRTATYNLYSRARWLHKHDIDENRDDEDYIDPTDIDVSRERQITTFKEIADLPEYSNIDLLGELDEGIKANPIPLPHFTLAIDIGDLETEASIDCNSLGTVRMHNSDYSVVEYSVWIGKESTTEILPTNYDLETPAQELESLRRICHRLDLYNKNLTTREKIRKIRRFFNTEFKYTTHLTTAKIERGKRQSAIGIFLETTRAGHCEYFATSAALLLREANVPARYCVGFSVNELNTDRDEWLMRGTHAHAWCRVWIEEKNKSGQLKGHWEDVDLTPAAWESIEGGNTHLWKQKLADWWQRLREDFLIWRTRETNKTKVYIVVVVIVTLLLLWISWRLWQTRQRRSLRKNPRYQRPNDSAVTPLHKLERLAAKKIGSRTEGTPLGEWLQGIGKLDDSTEHQLEDELSRAIELHSVIRFDPEGSTPEKNHELRELCVSLRKRIKELPSKPNKD